MKKLSSHDKRADNFKTIRDNLVIAKTKGIKMNTIYLIFKTNHYFFIYNSPYLHQAMCGSSK